FSFTKQAVLSVPTNSAQDIARHSFKIFCESYDFAPQPPVRALTIQTYNLVTENFNYQPTMFDTEVPNAKAEKLGESLDEIRLKFGLSSITKASFIDSDFVTHQKDDTVDVIPFQKNNRH
ncbi:MAG: hypothetical protein RR107_00740, partial [Clostridia bacterium]